MSIFSKASLSSGRSGKKNCVVRFEETSKIVLDDQGELLVYENDDQKIERILD